MAMKGLQGEPLAAVLAPLTETLSPSPSQPGDLDGLDYGPDNGHDYGDCGQYSNFN